MGAKVFDNPKDHEIIVKLNPLHYAARRYYFDSFAGSGTTGHSVLLQNSEDNGKRRFILVEMDNTIAQTITAERIKRVICGYDNTKGLGGGFRYCELGETLFEADGQIRAEVSFEDLARHVYFSETGQPLPEEYRGQWPLLGVKDGVGVYLLFNGIMKDKSADGGNMLTRPTLAKLPQHDGPKVIYGNGTLLSPSTLQEMDIIFRQVPYEIKVS